MLTYTAQTFTDLNINLKKNEITFKDTVYYRYQIISKKYKDKALNLAKEIGKNDLESLLVEHNLFFSVWLEKVSSLTKDKELKNTKAHPSLVKETQMIEEKNDLENLVNQRLKDLGI